MTVHLLVACRLIPLNRNSRLRPIGVGEVLKRISGKVFMMISKQDVIKAAGSLQVCVRQEASAEAVIHAVHDIDIQVLYYRCCFINPH